MIGKMAAFQIQNLLVAYKERFDKDNFIKNLLLDNLLLVDIYSRAKKLYIPVDAQRVVLIIECSAGREDNILEQMRPVFGNNNRDFITAVDENNVIIVKALTENDEMKEIEHYTANLTEWLETEGYSESRISYGTIVQEIKEVSRSYKEAKMPAIPWAVAWNVLSKDFPQASEIRCSRSWMPTSRKLSCLSVP